MSSAARSRLRVITVQTPCHVDWSTMSGGDAVRHCGSCRKNVYNLSAMTEADAEALLSSAEDHCIRYYYRADGTIVSSSCADTRHKASSAVAAGLAATLTASAAFTGIQAAIEQPEQAALASEDRVLVAMGMMLTSKPRARGEGPVSDVPPVSFLPGSDVTPSVAPACSDPWGCDEPAPETQPQLVETTSLPVETARASSRAGVLVGLLGGLVALLALSLAFVRRHVKLTHR